MKRKWISIIMIVAIVMSVQNVLPAPRATAEACSTAGDYRSAQSGNWGQMATWEYCDGSNWIAASATPTYTDNVITIRNGHTVTVATNVTVDQVMVEAGGQVTINSGVTFTTNDGPGIDLSIYGTFQHSGTVPNPMPGQGALASGGTYIHNTTSSAGRMLDFFGSNIADDSNFIYRGSSSLTPAVSVAGRTYGNLSFESTAGNWTANVSGATPFTVKGNFTIGPGVTYNTAQTGKMTFAGNFTNNGTLTNGTGTQVYTFTGNGKTISGAGAITFETWNVNSGASITLGRDVTIASGFVATITGTLNCETNAVTGDGAFTLISGATLGIGSADGIDSGTAAGNIRVSGTRTFDPAANYIFNGSAAQVTGTGFPAIVNDLTINNSSGVSLSADATVNGTLTLTNGLLTLGNSNLTLGSGASIGGTPDASRMIALTGTGKLRKRFTDTGSFTFPVGDATGTAEYSPVTLNFTGGTFGANAYAAVWLLDSAHPSNNTTSLLTRYWTVTSNDITGFSCNATFNYVDDDIVGTESYLKGLQYSAGNWTIHDPVNEAGNNFTINNLTGFSDFTAGGNPTAVTLAHFEATPQEGAIRLSWQTATELYHQGFNLYRSTALEGDYILLNDALIRAKNPGNMLGASYDWVDSQVQPGVTYYYKLEDVELSGGRTLHGPVSATLRGKFTLYLPVIIANP